MRLLVPLVISAALALGGCTAVAPWERGVLAKPHMALESDRAAAYRAQVQSSREAGYSMPFGEGGGCGCY